jgi:hypothetical protein
VCYRVYIYVWRYPVNFSVHYNIHYITFTILVRETWNDYHFPPQKSSLYTYAVLSGCNNSWECSKKAKARAMWDKWLGWLGSYRRDFSKIDPSLILLTFSLFSRVPCPTLHRNHFPGCPLPQKDIFGYNARAQNRHRICTITKSLEVAGGLAKEYSLRIGSFYPRGNSTGA